MRIPKDKYNDCEINIVYMKNKNLCQSNKIHLEGKVQHC